MLHYLHSFRGSSDSHWQPTGKDLTATPAEFGGLEFLGSWKGTTTSTSVARQSSIFQTILPNVFASKCLALSLEFHSPHPWQPDLSIISRTCPNQPSSKHNILWRIKFHRSVFRHLKHVLKNHTFFGVISIVGDASATSTSSQRSHIYFDGRFAWPSFNQLTHSAEDSRSLCPSMTHMLTSLGIHVPSYDVDAFTVLRFSNLKKFDLTADSWSSITSILSSMNCTFTALSVCCLDKSESLSDLRTLLTILRCSFGFLTTIHLESRKTSFDSFDVGMEVRDAFHSLLTLKFAFMKELLEAGSAWPLLESFRVDVSHFLGKTVWLWGATTPTQGQEL